MNECLKGFSELPGNLLPINRVQSNAYSEVLDPLLLRLLRLNDLLPSFGIFPVLHKNKHGSRLFDFLICSDQPELTKELHSIGNAYFGNGRALISSSITYENTKTVVNDPFVNYLFEHCEINSLFKIRVHQEGAGEKDKKFFNEVLDVLSNLSSMISAFQDKPGYTFKRHRSIGRVLRDFYSHIYSRKTAHASETLEELRVSGHLSARNESFLEVQLLSISNNYDRMFHASRIQDAFIGFVPGPVVHSFLSAIHSFASNLIEFDKDDYKKCIDVFEKFDKAFIRRLPFIPGENDIDLLKVWIIGRVHLSGMGIVEKYIDFLDEDWISRLGVFFGQRVPSKEATDLNSASALLAQGENYELGIKIISLIFNEQLTAIEEQELIKKLSHFSDDLIKRLSAKRHIKNFLVSLGIGVYGKSSDSWSDFFSEIHDSDLESTITNIDERMTVLEKDTWRERYLIECINNGSEIARINLRNMLPSIMSWCDRNNVSLSKEAITTLMFDFATDDLFSVGDLTLCESLVEGLFAYPLSKSEYDDLIDLLILIWGKSESVVSVETVISLIDFLGDLPSPSPEKQCDFWRIVQSFIILNSKKFDNETLGMANAISNDICHENGVIPLAFIQSEEGVEAPEALITVPPFKVTIYSLLEKASLRAMVFLKEKYPELEISLNCDHEATESLNHLAKTSDIFIFDSRASKHQAYYAVKKLRKKVIYPDGKGSVSLIRAVQNEITTLIA